MSEDAEIEPMTFATLALTARRSNHLARSHHIVKHTEKKHQENGNKASGGLAGIGGGGGGFFFPVLGVRCRLQGF